MNNSIIKYLLAIVFVLTFNQVHAKQSDFYYGRIERINRKTGKVKLVDLQEEIARLEKKLERKGFDIQALRKHFNENHEATSFFEQEYTWAHVLGHLARATKELAQGAWLTGGIILTTIVPIVKDAISKAKENIIDVQDDDNDDQGEVIVD